MSFRPKPFLGQRINTAHLLSKDLILCYAANEKGGSRLYDLSGNNNHGTINKTQIGWIPEGLTHLNDGQQPIILDNAIEMGANYTVAISVQPAFANTILAYHMLFGAHDADNYFGLTTSASSTQHRIQDSGNNNAYFDYDPWSANDILNLVLLNDGTNWTIYRNGIKGSSAAYGTHLLINEFFNGYNTDSFAFIGNIFYFYVWKRKLTPSEITEIDRNPFVFIEDPYPIELFGYVAAGSITLTVAEMDGAGAIDNVSLTQAHTLTVQELLSNGILDNVALVQAHILAIQELLSSGSLDNVSLIQKHVLVIQELLSSGLVDNVDLIQSHILAVQELISSNTLDNIDLIQKHILVIQELASAGLLDNIDLVQLILEQEGFRWRTDDGSESAATWLALQDIDITRAKEINTRLRVLINATGDPTSKQFKVQYKKTSDATWRDMPVSL